MRSFHVISPAWGLRVVACLTRWPGRCGDLWPGSGSLIASALLYSIHHRVTSMLRFKGTGNRQMEVLENSMQKRKFTVAIQKIPPWDLSFSLIWKIGKIALSADIEVSLSKVTSEADTATGCQLCLHMSGLHHLKIVITAFTLNALTMLASHKILLWCIPFNYTYERRRSQ